MKSLLYILDDIKSAYRRVERVRKGETFEESEQVKRVRIANRKYADDYEIGESSKASDESAKLPSATKSAVDKRKALTKQPTAQITSNFKPKQKGTVAQNCK